MGANLSLLLSEVALNTQTLMQQTEPDGPRWWILTAMFGVGFLAGTMITLWLGMVLFSQHWTGLHFANPAF